MSKKILFMSSAKLTAISIGLLLAVFCTIGMSFRPVYNEDEAAEIVMSGPRRAHWYYVSSGCTGDEYHYYSSVDKAITTVQTRGNGTVTISTTETTNVTEPSSGTPRTATSGSATGNSASISWNSGLTESGAGSPTYTDAVITAAHQKNFTISATPSDPDEYYFAGWGTTTEESSINNTDNPRNIMSDMNITTYTKTNNSSAPSSPNYSSTAYPETYYAFFKPRVTVNITLEPDANGSISYSYKNVPTTTISAETTFNTKYDVTLTATPVDGYKFFGWYTLSGSTENYISYANPSTRAYKENTTIYAKFIPATWAVFGIKDTENYYYDLNRAVSEASGSTSKVVYLKESGLLNAGNYTITTGVSLYIPYSTSTSVQTTPTIVRSEAALTAYRTLTLTEGANITCNGSSVICIGGQIMSANGGKPSGYTTGPCGMIDMSRGGHIELNNKSKLYCWGFVKGQDMDQGNNTVGVGTITANSGATVWENLAFGDWRGGTACSSIISSRFFPFQSYFVQNIEVPLTVKYGATESCYSVVYGNDANNPVSATMIASSGALFKTSSGGDVRKWYDPTTDLMCFELSGTANLDAITISGLPVVNSVSSSGFDLPISSNMHIILTNSSVTLSKRMVLQPGAKIEIKNDANITINENIYLYDKDDWGLYVVSRYFRNYGNTYGILTIHKNRGDGTSKELLDDAQLIVDGTLSFGSAGKLFSTAGGADVMGNGGGRVNFPSTLASSTTIDAYTGNGDKVSGGVAVNTANLHNEDDSYTQAQKSKTFLNINGRWFNQTDGAAAEKANHTYDFTYISSGEVSGTGGTSSTTDAVYSWDKTGLELRQKWANVTADACANWWHGQGEQSSWFYNWTLNSDWHQFMPTATEGMYSGSNNKIYTKTDCAWEELGETDVNCLYEIGGVKKALVDGQFIALEPNNNDPAYHAADDAAQYYICFEGCNWHAADKYAEAEKAYIIAPDTFIWYDNAWMSVNFQEPFAYTMSETNVPIYYEYLNGEWVLAEPYVRVVDGMEDRSYYFIEDAFTFANSVLRTAPTITILRDISGITTALSYTGANKTCTLDLNGHTITGSVSSMLTINGTGCTFIIDDNTTEKKGKISMSCEVNARYYTVNVKNGTLVLNNGTIFGENTLAYNSSSAKSTAISVIYVAAGKIFTMNGGTVHAKGCYAARGVDVAGSTSANATVNINSGTITAETTQASTAYGIYAVGGTTKVKSGATINAIATTTTAYGICIDASTKKYFGSLEMTGGTVNVESRYTSTSKDAVAAAVYVGGTYIMANTTPNTISAPYRAVANISGGTFNVVTTTARAAYGVRTRGTTTITGGTFNVMPKTTMAYGIWAEDGIVEVSSSATFTAKATATAYGIYANGVTPDDKTGRPYNPVVTVKGGTFNVQTTSKTTAYGVFVNGNTRPITSTESGYYAGNYSSAGNVTVNGGIFNVTAKTTAAYGAYVAAPKEEAGAADYDPATANPKCTINGGYFKLTGTSDVNAVNNLATTDNLKVQGGYYSHNGYLENYKVSPKQVLTLAPSDPNRPDYEYKVADAYLITFKTEDGTGEDLQSSYQEAGATPVYSAAEPTKGNSETQSFVFDGWATEANGAKTYNPNGLPNVSADATYYAHFNPTTLKYRVHLDATTNGGLCETENIYIAPGTAVGTLPNATKVGHTFNGWFSTSAATGGTQLVTSTVINADAEYFARFTVNSNTLTWHLDGGKVTTAGTAAAKNATGSPSSSVNYGAPITVPVVAKTGYTFIAWSPNPAITMPDEDVTYTALWNPNTNTAYTVKHYLQNADGVSYPATPYETEALTGTTGAYVTPVTNIYNGYSSPTKQTVTIAADGTTVVNYYYPRLVYTFILDAATNGGTSDLPSIEVIHGATIGAVPPDAQKGCNDFTGWYTKPVGGVKITPEFVIEYDMKTLYAQFSDDVRTYPITYNAGANGTGTVTAGTKTCSVDATLSSSTFTRDGYAQTGWSLTDGGAQAYALGGTYTTNAALTLYPVWAAVTYNLTYEGLNGATNSNPATYTIETATITLANPGTRAGYTFTGWTCGGSPITQIALGSTGDKTITANWSAVTYNLTYEGLNGATNSNPATYTIETATITLANPGTRAGYAFTGWTCGDSPITQIALGSTGDKVITANWEQIGVTILWQSEDGGTILETDEGVVIGATPSFNGETPTKPTTAEYTYTFDGWTTEANGEGTFYAIGELPAVAAAAAYYAHFTATANVASVTVGGATTYYTTIDAAFEYVNTASANMTITMLANATAAASLVYQPTSTYTCTLDLNNHTISGSVAKLIDINLAKSTFIITDNSVAKGGKVDNNYNENARAYGVFLTAGTFKLQNGTISSTNPHTYSTASANKNSAASAVYVTAGQTFTMDNGTVESASQYASYAIYMARGTSTVTINNGLVKGRTTKSTTAAGIYNLGKGLTVNGGRIIGHAYTTTAYGIYLYGGSGTIKGGTIEATNDTTSSKGTTTTYGIYVNYYNGTYKGVLTIPSTSTVNVLAKARTTTSYAIVVGGSSTGSTIAGGTFTAKTMTGKTAYAVNSSGNITISGGTFIANSATTNAYGLYSVRGTITVSGNPTFNVTSGTSTAYGALAYGTIGKKGTGKYSGTIKINGGTFNVTSTSTDAYGALAGLASRDLRSCSATNDTVPGLHYMPGILEITNGTFNVKAKTTVAYGVHVTAAKNESGDVGTTTRIPLGTITGGKFKVESMGDANATAYAMTTTTTAARLVVQGGYYSTKAISATANIEDKYTAPMKEDCNYYVLDLPSSELPYKYEVAEAYTITFKNGEEVLQSGAVKRGQTPSYTGTPTKEDESYTYTFDGWSTTEGGDKLATLPAVTATATYYAHYIAVSKETGFWLDIIDVDNANHKLVVNAGNYAHWSEWPYSINGETYYANTASGTPARDEKNRLEINYGNLEPGAEFPITITKDATVTSKHTYIIPQEVKTPVTLSDNAPRPIFVKGTTLTIDGDVETKNIYVGDDAKLVINEGKTLTADTIFLRTTPEGAAELINQGTISASTQLCYTRIIMVKGQYYQFGLPLPCAISSVKLSDNATLKYQTGWLLRAYSESKRAAQGAEGKNWETLKAAATIEGGKGYEMYSGSNYYREFYFPVNHADLANNKELTVTRTKDGAAGEKHAGWNVLVSPLTYTCNNVAQPEDMAICLMTSSGWEDQTVLEHIAPAQPFAYQAEEAGTISFVSATMPSLAPRRRIAAADESTRIQWIRLDVKDANGEGDETNIYSHPTRYEQYYQTGIDVAKQSLTAARARLYSSHAYGDMAFAGVSDELFEQGVALTVYSPAAQELTFSLRHNEWLNRLQYVWIIDFETGAMIDLFSSDYTAEVTEGTTYGRFYISGRFRTPQIATDIDEAQGDEVRSTKAQKVLIEEKIYIMVGDKLYDATGKLVKGK